MDLRLKRNVSKSGRGLVLRIPVDIVKTLGFTEDSEVWIWIEEGRMIVEKAEASE